MCIRDRFKVVPFGLVTSLAAMVKCLELALGLEVDDFVSVFVDDILIISKSFEEHMQMCIRDSNSTAAPRSFTNEQYFLKVHNYLYLST